MAYPKYFGWVDIETTGLPPEGTNDFSKVYLLEFALLVTDFELDPLVGYSEVVKMTPEAANEIRGNDYVRKMHTESGLLKESIAGGKSVAEVEAEILDILTEEDGTYMLAGSGVATYDFQWLKEHMPAVARKFAYFPADVGVLRRMSKILAGKDVVNPTIASYGESKEHRALADVKAHLEEARSFQAYFRGEN